MLEIFFTIVTVIYFLLVAWDMLRNRSCISMREVGVKALPVLLLTALAVVDLTTGDSCGKMMRLASYLLLSDVVVICTPDSFVKSTGVMICLWTAILFLAVFLLFRAGGYLPAMADAAIPLEASLVLSIMPLFMYADSSRTAERNCFSILCPVPALMLFLRGMNLDDSACPLVVIVLMSMLLYLSLRNFAWAGRADCPEDKPVVETVTEQPEETSTGDEVDKMDDLYRRLEDYMQDKAPYLNENLSLGDLAAELYTNKTYLSKTINQKSGKNFCQYINQYRVNYAVSVIERDKRVKVLELAIISGFHSVASFNMAFRLFMGDTPSEYMRTLRAEELMTHGSLSRKKGQEQ